METSIQVMPQPEEIERPDEGWKYPYVGAAVDWGSNLVIRVRKEDARKIGYTISPELSFSNADRTVLGFLDEFCMNHGMNPNLRADSNTYRLDVSKRDDLYDLLRLVRPFVIARQPEVSVLVEDLIPGLDGGKGSSKEGFLELMEYVDQIREETHGTGNRKYDEAYFRDLWGL